ncbi:hypothetical protein [uncultured Sulfitobacter sp.]|uniref:hypothetical protein n=1 Tax=uncultured Sulfitobacter sp. TaxID=191468 RepID=UPI00262EBB1F|nr:hypothetical protein [uncultured Sulfitobacter sp.]
MKNAMFIFDALSDLAKFAGKNELPELERIICEAQHVALNEITQKDEKSNYRAVMDAVYPKSKDLNPSENTK